MLQVAKGRALGIVGAYWNAFSKKRVVVFAVTFSLPCLWFGTKGEKGGTGGRVAGCCRAASGGRMGLAAWGRWRGHGGVAAAFGGEAEQ